MRSEWLRRGMVISLLLLALPARSQVMISEFMASNFRTLADEDSDYSDWIELYNAGSAPVNLNGWFLTDEISDLTKWRFPSTNLAPNSYLLVFASGKDRKTAGAPLHTDFKLDSGGEYLALVAPGATNTAFAYAPGYPPQVAGVSYGVPMSKTPRVLVSAGAPTRVRVPLDDSLGTDWTAPEFDDSGWLPAAGGLGYANSAQSAWLPVPVADSGAQFSGVQGQDNWFYGYYNKTADPVAGYVAADFAPFPRDSGPASASNYWNGASWQWFNGDPPWVQLGELFMQPNGVNNGKEIWAIRRWVSKVSGHLTVEWRLAKQAALGSGVTARLFHNGEMKGFILIEGDDLVGMTKTNVLPNVQVGDLIDFALLPTGLSNASDDRGDGSYLSATIWADRSLADMIGTDLGASMRNVNPSVYCRAVFELEAGTRLDFLTLRVRYSGGFAAFLNGVLVAAEGAPSPLAWNAAATEPRTLAEAVQVVEFDLSAYRGLVHAGTNVLALQGLSPGATADDFLLQAELRGTTLNLNAAAYRYFALPTPGGLNGFGNLRLGPLIRDVQHFPAVPRARETVLVTAQITPTFDQVREVSLVYRVMYGAEARLLMWDDGLHGDALAGDGYYGALLPATATAVAGQMVRYAITALDNTGDVSRSPPYPDPANSPQYYGTVVANPALTNALPVLEWFLQTPSAADSSQGTRCSVFYAGEFYDNVRAYLHGQSSREFPKKSYNFNFNTGYPFRYDPRERRVRSFDLLTTYPDKAHMRNLLAYETFRDAGSPYHAAFPVRVQRNGEFFSDAHWVESANEDFLERLGLNPQGALYKMYNSLESSSTGVEKKTRESEKNTDLQGLVSGLNLTTTARARYLYDNVDLPEVVNYLAAMAITGNIDFGHKNYYVYKDTGGTDLWKVFPWDVDLSFGRNWTSTKTYYDDAMYVNNPLFVSNGNRLFNALYGITPIRQMYSRRVRTLMDELLQPTNTPPAELKLERRINELATLIGPDAALDYAKWRTWGETQNLARAVQILTNTYLPARRNFLFKNQTAGANPNVPAAQPADAVLVFGALEPLPASGRQEEEYIQLLNRNTYAVDISGWRLTGAIEHTFHPGTVAPASGALYVTPSVAAFRKRAASPRGGEGLFAQGNYRGQLSARGGSVGLVDRNERVVATATYAANPSLAQQYLRVTEIMYHPAPPPLASPFVAQDFEYVVLRNIGPRALDLTGVHFTNGIDFSFTGSAVTNLSPGESVVVTRNLAAFTSRYGRGARVAGEFTGSLDNQGERLRVDDRVGEIILDFAYQPRWYPATDGQGLSLVTVDDQTPWSAWGEKQTWRPSSLATGETVAEWKARYFSPLELAQPAVSGDQADVDGDGLTNLEEFLAGTSPRDGASRLRFLGAARSVPGGAGLRLSFPVVAGRSYSVQYRDSVAGGPWQKLRDLAPPAADDVVELAVDDDVTSTGRFYRLVTPRAP